METCSKCGLERGWEPDGSKCNEEDGWACTKRQLVKEKAARQELQGLMARLLMKVNRVTGFHRHGNPIPESALTKLSDYQIVVEEQMRKEL